MRSNQPLRDPPGRDRRRVRPQAELEEPILAELFSVERLEQHAQTLAAAQKITDAPRRGRAVGPRIAENGRVLLESYRVLARAIKDERSITPAAEWLVDNFHIVDEQLREIRDDLPPDYYRELPKLADGPPRGLPAGPRPRLGLRRPHRQPLRPGEPAAHGARLPGRGAADDRRAVGDRDQPADPPRREPAAPGGADRAQPGRAAEGGRARRQPARPRRGQRRRPRRRPCAGSRARRSRRRPASSSSSGCATRTRRSRPPSAGWRSSSRPRAPRPRRSSASSTSARRR